MNNLIYVVVALMILGGGYYYFGDKMSMSTQANEVQKMEAEFAGTVKEFSMDSGMIMTDGKMSAYFSIPEIKVKKGEKVVININNVKGKHDFVIDEFSVNADTPEGAVTKVEFIADKSGTFEYYCSKYNHRSLGQVGKLIVE